jgi:hypothetical protein
VLLVVTGILNLGRAQAPDAQLKPMPTRHHVSTSEDEDEDRRPLLHPQGDNASKEIFSTDEHGEVTDTTVNGTRPPHRPPALTSVAAIREVGKGNNVLIDISHIYLLSRV